MASSSGAGTGKMLEKLERSTRSGNYYEAEQMCKSVSARYLAQHRFEDAMDLLQSGACLQLEHGQVNGGVELGKLLVEAISKSAKPCSPPLLDRILTVFRVFATPSLASSSIAQAGASTVDSEGNSLAPPGAAPPASAAPAAAVQAGGAEGEAGTAAAKPSPEAVAGAIEFLKTALRWSMRVEGGAKMGAPELHDCLAQCYWGLAEHKDLNLASQHFVLGTSPNNFALALFEVLDLCFPDETDLVATRAVLQYLASGNLRGANEVLELLQAPPPALVSCRAEPPAVLPDSPLMHFVAFLLLTLERDAYPLFSMLRAHYQPSIERDRTFNTLLDDIAEKFYGIRQAPGGIFGGLMQMLMAP